MVTINSTDNFLKDFASTCKNVQKKSFKKNQTITTYKREIKFALF